jgi:hypothetical protein
MADDDMMGLKKKMLAAQQARGRTLGEEDVRVQRIQARAPSSALVGGGEAAAARRPIVWADADPTDSVIIFDLDPTDRVIVIDF